MMKFNYLLLLSIFTVSFTGVRANQPNIVFFFIDDQTSSTLGCYGNEIVHTPVIDGLASKGTRFANSFVSHSICWVSRASVLTGLTGRGFGTPSVPDHPSPEAAKEFYTDILRQNGYRTGFFGKWHTRLPKGNLPQSHFDIFESISRNPFYKKMPDGSLRHETELIVDKGIEFMKNQPPGKPFALNMWFNACHAEDSDRRPGIGHFPWPRAVDGMYENMEISRGKLDTAEILNAQPDFLKTTINRERYFWRWNTDYKYNINIRAYYRMTSGIDGAIGRFIQALDEAGLSENTIIVYSADNGYHMGNRGFAGKWSHYEESLRVPLIIMDPRLSNSKQGKVIQASAMNIDLPATFLDWAGINVPERYQGRSLKPLVEACSEPTDWRNETYHEHFAVRSRIPAFEAIRNPEFKYVRYIDHGNHEFLHNLQSDPDELVNLASDSKYSEVLNAMRERTTQRMLELGKPLEPLNQFSNSTEPWPEAESSVASKPGPDGFSRVFDGRSLRGWVGDSQYWSVQDGAITGTTDGSLKMNRFLTWKESTVRNFDLHVKVKVSKAGNSGIQYRGHSRPDLGLDVVTGYQCDVVANVAKYNGMLYEEKGRRILSHTGEKVIVDESGQPWVVGNLPFKEFAPDEWHEYRVLVRGNHHQHWINGHPTADLIDLDEKNRSLEGLLAVQVHVGPAMKIQYKDFRLKHLPDDLPILNSKDSPIPYDAYGVRPQGKLPENWKAPIYGKQ